MGMLMQRHKVGATEKVAPATIPNEKEVVVEEEKKYSKSDISRMNTADLQKLAKELGVKDANKMSGNALKPLLIDKLGL